MRIGRAVGAAGLLLLALALPAGAEAQGFGCSASALRGTVLGTTAIEPVVANAGSAACRTTTAGSGTLGLPAPLQATTLAAGTFFSGPANRVDQQAAGASGAVGALRVPLPELPLVLPDLDSATAQVPAAAGLPLPIELPLPELPLPVAIPDVGTVDLRPALLGLLPAPKLPEVDLLGVRTAAAQATARCVGGRPELDGLSEVTGLDVLGTELPIGEVVERTLTIIDSSSIDPSLADLAQIPLPAGVGLDDQGVRDALQGALDDLPPIAVPATLAQVKVTPGAQSRDATRLLQQALRVEVSVLGTNIANLVLGEAAVSAAGVDCSPAAAASAARLQCSKRRLVLADVVERNGRVRFVGAADRALIGRRVNITFTDTGERVATAVVKRDGSFGATSALPRLGLRGSNRERFQAVLGREKSLDLKLHRRMLVTDTRSAKGKVTIIGKVIQPLAAPVRTIEVRRRISCNREQVVRRFKPRSDGTFRVTVPAPPKQLAAVYRLATRVRKTRSNPKTYETFTLPQAVALG